MENDLVKCKSCEWQTQQEGYDPTKHTCIKCHNTRLVPDPRDILCNLCGECMCPIGTMNEQYPHGLHNASVVGGYDSYHLFDMTEYTFSFCEKCLRQLFMKCKIKPQINDIDFHNNKINEYSWDDDQIPYEYKLWKDSGAHHQAYLDKKCNAIKDCPNTAIYSVLFSDDFTEDTSCEEHKDHWNYSTNSKLVLYISEVAQLFI